MPQGYQTSAQPTLRRPRGAGVFSLPDRVTPSKRSLYASYAAGLFSMGQAESLTMVVPLWAVLQGV